MIIKKRNGTHEKLDFNKISKRLRTLATDKSIGPPLKKIDTDVIVQKVIIGLYDKVSSSEIDEESARIAVNLTDNSEFSRLASRIIISNNHKNTLESFTQAMVELHKDAVVSDEFIALVKEYSTQLDEVIDYNLDYMYDYFGFKTLEKSYLGRVKGADGKIRIRERPQHLLMRVALDVFRNDIDNVIKAYTFTSQHVYTHASPCLFNSGKVKNNMISCYLMGITDSLEGIMKGWSDCGRISKIGGGIGMHIGNIRSKGSLIRGTNGVCNGIVPMLKVYDNVSVYVDQSGMRKGSFAMYLEPWHDEIMSFIDLRKNNGHENVRARNLFYALWVPDYFMNQVKINGDWHLMCPNDCPGLQDSYGDEFKDLYTQYVSQGKFKQVIKAQTLWKRILETQIETGMPYIGFKDSVNKKNNQKNLGTIKSSNLCMEISLYSDDTTHACCNLVSIALPKFVEYKRNKPFFNFDKLHEIAKFTVVALNKVIDNTYYPTPETRASNTANRPLGIGIQGLADVFIKMRIQYDSPEAARLNIEIAEALYHGTIESSIELSKIDGPYSTFKGSPFSEGKLQFDLAKEFDGIDLEKYLSGRYDWDKTRTDMVSFGMRNSMLTANMPTASTAVLMGNMDSFEPITSCFYKRRVLSGEFTVINKYLMTDLLGLDLWTNELKEKIILNKGSIQGIDEIPQELQDIYKTVWEIDTKKYIKMTADRQLFVDQMQSMNLYLKESSVELLNKLLFYGWKNKVKTGSYYTRITVANNSAMVTINPEHELKDRTEAQLQCSIDNKDECLLCTS